MRAGGLDRLISIEFPSVTQDPNYGTPVIIWAPLITTGSPPAAELIPANVQDMVPSRSEGVKLGLTVARNQVRVRFRFIAEVESAMRIIEYRTPLPNRTLQIVGGPATLGRNEGTEVVCEVIT